MNNKTTSTKKKVTFAMDNTENDDRKNTAFNNIQETNNKYEREVYLRKRKTVKKTKHVSFSKNITITNNVSPVFTQVSNDNRPYLTIKIFDHEIVSLVDSGANTSIIGSAGLSLLKKFNLTISRDSNIPMVTTADGTIQEVQGIVHLPVTVNETSKMLKVLVLPTVKNSLILGTDFCKQFGITMNFLTSTWNNQLSTINVIKDRNELSTLENQKLEEVIAKYEELGNQKLGRTTLITHSIDTGDAKPVKQRHYALSPAMQEHMNAELDKMLSLGVVRPSKSPWSSPVILVKKPSGEYRACFDGRKLNSLTKKDAFPLPLIDNILNKLRDAQFLSSIDLKHAFWQVPLDASSCEKTAFTVPTRGLFEYVTMPFGLSNSPQSMQRLMEKVLDATLDPFIYVYLDDIIIVTATFEKHLEILEEVHSRLIKAGLTVNFKKCEFCLPSLSFLGFTVGKEGLKTSSDKVDIIVNYAQPKTATEIKRLIGLVSYYRRFIKDFATLCAPISNLIHGKKKRQPIEWNDEADKSFKEIKVRLSTAPILASPDFSQPFIIQCDASNYAAGYCLYQEVDGIEHPIAYGSKTFNKCQRNYTVTERECLAVIFGIEKFRPYVEGTRFTIITDHYSLLWLDRLKDPTGRLARWAVKLSQYNYEIKHRKGSLHVVPDFLSRIETNLIDVSSIIPDDYYQEMSDNVKVFPSKYPTFRLENDLLLKHVPYSHHIESNLPSWKIVVPKKNRKAVFRECHNDPTAGHFGNLKTLARISDSYYWPKMRRDVARLVKHCNVCAAQKSPNTSRPGLMGDYKNISFPFQMISTDLCGPLPRSKGGNQFILVIVDWFTKYVLVKAIPKATSKAIVNFMENEVFLKFGVPQIIVCDNGSQYISKEFRNFAERYGVQQIKYNARYHPQHNHTERINRIIITAISSYIHENHRVWDENIHKVTHAINTAQHEVTGYSPAFLNLARNIPLSGSYYGPVTENDKNIPLISNKNQLLKDIQELTPLYAEVRQQLFAAYEKNARQYNLRKRTLKFSLGDRVWKRNFILSNAANFVSAKLAPKFLPCIISRVVSHLVYELQDLEGNNLGQFHVKDLKPDLTFSDDDEVEEASRK
jgi:transposase InsO family protein